MDPVVPSFPSGSVHVVPGSVFIVPGWLPKAHAQSVHVALLGELTTLLQPHRGFRGHPDPSRLTARLGDPGVSYVYGGKARPLSPLPIVTNGLRGDLQNLLGVQFNCVYVNQYVNGDSSIPRHSDTAQLPQLGPSPVIACVSFGVTRVFQLWDFSSPRDKSKMVSVPLESGDLCIMYGASQSAWLHGVSKQKDVVESRLSLTFRFHHS